MDDDITVKVVDNVLVRARTRAFADRVMEGQSVAKVVREQYAPHLPPQLPYPGGSRL